MEILLDTTIQIERIFKRKRRAQIEDDLAGVRDKKMRSALSKIIKEGKPLKGDICRSLGDCIISLEALETTGKAVCTTNIKDFKPVCEHINVGIWELEDT